jgi:hypothetical protein
MSSGLVRSFVAVAAAATSFLSVVAARAQSQPVDEFGGYGAKRGEQSESKQDAAFELRFGRYVAEVDSPLDTTPFHDTFGSSNRYMMGAELDWQLLRIPHLGSLGPGFGWGVTKYSARAPFANGSGYSAADTRIWIMPAYVVGVLRADVISRDFKIPLVPYAKLGLGYALWWSSDGDKSASEGGKAGRGASYGLTYALGAMFLLDVLSPDDAITADGLTGINNSYVFAEWFRPQLDGFGSNKVLDVSSSSWVLGIAIEM